MSEKEKEVEAVEETRGALVLSTPSEVTAEFYGRVAEKIALIMGVGVYEEQAKAIVQEVFMTPVSMLTDSDLWEEGKTPRITLNNLCSFKLSEVVVKQAPGVKVAEADKERKLKVKFAFSKGIVEVVDVSTGHNTDSGTEERVVALIEKQDELITRASSFIPQTLDSSMTTEEFTALIFDAVRDASQSTQKRKKAALKALETGEVIEDDEEVEDSEELEETADTINEEAVEEEMEEDEEDEEEALEEVKPAKKATKVAPAKAKAEVDVD